MKYLIILGFICSFVAIEAKKRYGPEERCTTDLHLNRKKMKAVVNEDNTTEDDQKAGEFLVCVFKRRGITDKDGNVKEDGLRNFLQTIFFDTSTVTEQQKVTVQHVFDQCKGIRRDTHQKTAIKLKNCIAKYVKEYESEL